MYKVGNDNEVFHFLCVLPQRGTKCFVSMQNELILPDIHSSQNYMIIYGKPEGLRTEVPIIHDLWICGWE